MQVWQRRAELPGPLACVTFTGPESLLPYVRGLGLEDGLACFCDPGREAYQALGFGRDYLTTFLAMWRLPNSIVP